MSAAVQVGVFASGLLLGAGGATLFAQRRTHAPPAAGTSSPTPATPIRASWTAPAPAPEAAPKPATPAAHAPTSDALMLSGMPGPVADFLTHAAYVTSYDRRLRHAHWTAEHLTAESIRRPPGAEGINRAQSIFSEDARVPVPFRSNNADYFRSGYDRGHLVPAADAKQSQEAMNETFLLSNIAPQVGEGFNRDYWAHTEDFVRRLTGQFRDLYVFTVPLYLPRQTSDGKWRVSYEVIGSPPNVSVPTHFAKVILGVGLTASPRRDAMALGAFVLPNSRIPNEAPLRSFETDIEAVERAAGLSLFPAAIKKASKKLCDTVKCEIIVRDFSNKAKAVMNDPKVLPSRS